MLKLMLRKFFGTLKIVTDSTLFGLNSKRRDFLTFNRGIKYWGVIDHKQFEIRPVRDPSF